jgi:hypothetical protein
MVDDLASPREAFMSVDCWSVTAGPLKSEELHLHKSGASTYASLATLHGLPRAVILTAKATFRSTSSGDVGVIETMDVELMWALRLARRSTLRTHLLMEGVIVDSAWCNLFKYPDGATTVCLHGAVDLPPASEPKPEEPVRVGCTASLRIDDSAIGVSFEIANVWLTAVGLDSLTHKGKVPGTP